RFFWFLCGNEVYTDSFFRQIAIKVLPDKHFTLHKQKLSHKVEKSHFPLIAPAFMLNLLVEYWGFTPPTSVC
ncbi:MAG: hypothetical protein PX482_21870, partial [Microcystis sp. M53602_WE12]|nr:hypothetical protein [Microcystis sp. M53602_WE12]